MTKQETEDLLHKLAHRDIANGLEENVALGLAEVVGVDEDGQKLYRLTAEGIKRAESIISKAKAELELERS